MAPRILLISDLHLEEARPDITRALLGFLELNKNHCDALYILGDLFEVWIGDDEESSLSSTVASALKEFSAAGSSILIMHGNRDFLLGSNYASRCGATIVDDPAVIETDCGSILLSHGDSLCTDDVDYIQFRNMVRTESWQQEFLAQGIEQRRAFAENAREQSRMATSGKKNSIMDVNQAAVEKLLRETGQSVLIHGHTHRPAIHEFAPSDAGPEKNPLRRVVLGDWDQNPHYAEIDAQGIKLENFQLADQGS